MNRLSRLNDRKTPLAYRVVRFFVWLFFPKFQVFGQENLPEEPCVIVGNHSHMYGPVAGELYTPGKHWVWCAGEMMKKDEVAAYAYQDFWSDKPAYIRWFYKLLSHIITPLSILIFNNAHTVPVYHEARLITTFRDSIEKIKAGGSMVIFPECYTPYNNIIYSFQDKFVDLARFYYKKTGNALSFVPMYIAPELKCFYYGEPVAFRPDAPISEERKRICAEMMEGITKLATRLPKHVVVPYPNIPKRMYHNSIPLEVYCNETADV